MSFCPNCNTFLQPVEEMSKLYLLCRTCGFKEENKNNIITHKIYGNKTAQSTGSKAYLIYDNTLPRTTTKKCPNDNCESRKTPSLQDAVFYMDSRSMKQHYICAVCKTEWT